MGDGKINSSVPNQQQPLPLENGAVSSSPDVQAPKQKNVEKHQTAAGSKYASAPGGPSHAGSKIGDSKLTGRLREAQISATLRTKANLAQSVAGKQIGTLDKTAIVVARDHSPAGFKNRYEAIALARGLGSKNAAIYQDSNKRWHAIETNVPVGNKGVSNNLQYVGQPDLNQWNDLKQKAADAKRQFGPQDPRTQDAYRNQLAAALGVDPSEINIIRNEGDKPDLTKINFNPRLLKLGNAGEIGLDKPAFVQVGPTELGFDNPYDVISTTLHEETHVRHHDRANELLGEFKKTGQPMDKFKGWVEGQYKANKISVEERETTIGAYEKRTGPTEAASYITGFMSTFAMDRKDPLLEKLLYSNLGQAAIRSPLSDDFKKELMSRLEKLYQGLDSNDRQRFDAAMTRLKTDPQTKNTWLAKFQHN